MLKSLTVRGFKSLKDVTVELPRMAVLFGPNAAGKSNLLDAIQALSRIGTQRTLADALGGRRVRRGDAGGAAQGRGGQAALRPPPAELRDPLGSQARPPPVPG